MWGFYNSRDRITAYKIFDSILNVDIAKKFSKPKNKNRKGADQEFLTKYVYPYLREQSIIHDSFLCASYGGAKAFPTKRVGDCFVGVLICAKFSFLKKQLKFYF